MARNTKQNTGRECARQLMFSDKECLVGSSNCPGWRPFAELEMGKRPRPSVPQAWEQPEEAARVRSAWENWEGNRDSEREPDEWSEDSDNDWYEGLSPQDAGKTFVELLSNLYLEGKISAKSLCVLCWYAEQAGIQAAKDLSYKPSTKSVGHFSRHVDFVLGMSKINSYKLKLPSHCKYNVTRQINEFDVMLPHESIAAELERVKPDFDLQDAKVAAWEQFKTHPQYNPAAGELPIPLSLYLDGVPFTNKDSFLGIWLCNLCTGVRHIVGLFRKSDMCRCGCKSWCTLYGVFAYLAWSFGIMLTGQHPLMRHDQLTWSEHDISFDRLRRAGQSLGYRAVVVLLKGDWSEFSVTLGFTSWASKIYPCMYCCCTVDSQYDYTKLNPLMEDQWQEVEQTQYDAACDSCEVWVTLRTKEEHTSVRAVLKFDKRKQGAHGRALQKDIPSLGLLSEDRLEPHPGMPDVADFDSLNSFPVRVLFWRVSEQTRTRHRNPLFWPQTGVTTDALAIDILHTLHLGVILYFSSEVVWALLLGNIFGIAGGADDILHMGVFRIRDRLFAWYNQWDAAHPERPACRLGNFTVQMLGDRAHPRLHVRAAESYWMFFLSWIYCVTTRTKSTMAGYCLLPEKT